MAECAVLREREAAPRQVPDDPLPHAWHVVEEGRVVGRREHVNWPVRKSRPQDFDPDTREYEASQHERVGGDVQINFNTKAEALALDLLAALTAGEIVAIQNTLAQLQTQRDLIVVKSVVMLLVFAVILVNFLVDLSYAIVDPRLRRQR